MLKVPWELLNGWMPPEERQYWYSSLIKGLKWEKPMVKVYGKTYSVPRETVFLADHSISYYYSGLKHIGIGWPSWFSPLLNQVSRICETNFNGCLLNLYRDGNDRMGWHSDNEPELDSSKPIASLSLGSTREFHLKGISKQKSISLSLRDGDLLIMYPPCQEEWIHSVPIRKRVSAPRINLTFRVYL